MVKGTGGDDGFFGFGVDDDSKYLEVNRVKERWGKIVHLACKNGYIIKAIMHNGMEVSSSEVAPAIYPWIENWWVMWMKLLGWSKCQSRSRVVN